MTHPLSALGLPDVDRLYERVGARMVDVLRSDDEALTVPSTRMVEGNGKWARPIVVLATIKGLDGDLGASAIDAAVCVELLHVGTLVHDDVMDEATSRRGVPTVNAVEGWKNSIIVGDFMMGLVGQLASSISKEVAAEVSDAIVGVCMGQSQETAQLYRVDRTVEQALQSVDNKTAQLLASACRIGGLLVDASDETLTHLEEFGRAFGMQFQIIDDVLDLLSDEQRLGKPTGSDIPTGVFSLPVLWALEDPSVSDELRVALGSARDPRSAERARDLVRSSTGCAVAVEEARKFAAQAMDALDALVETWPNAKALGNLPSLYTDWALEKYVGPQWQQALVPATGVG